MKTMMKQPVSGGIVSIWCSACEGEILAMTRLRSRRRPKRIELHMKA